MTDWKNRIVREALEEPEQLLANPYNNKIHTMVQQDATTALLETVGWVQRVLVNANTQHVVDGHMRILLAIKHHQKQIPVTYLDLTEDEEQLILLTLDPIGQMAAYDRNLTAQLMEQVSTDNAILQGVMNGIAEQNQIIAPEAPEDFGEYGDDIETEYCCPKCQYRWSGKPNNDS